MIYTAARLLQLIGLVVLPFAVMSNVSGDVPLKTSLWWSGFGVTLFVAGWLLQKTTRPP